MHRTPLPMRIFSLCLCLALADGLAGLASAQRC